MRIDGTTWTGNPDRTIPAQGSTPAGALIPAGSGEGRRGHVPPLPRVAAEGFVLVHDEVHGAVVIDLYHAALRTDESPTYRLSREGAVEVGRKPRKGGIIDLMA